MTGGVARLSGKIAFGCTHFEITNDSRRNEPITLPNELYDST